MNSSEIKPLDVGHLMIAADILDAIMEAVPQEQLEDIMSGGASKVGFKVISLGIKHAKSGVVEIMADVNGMSVEEFKKQPILTVTRTLKALQADERNKDFFSQLAVLFGGQKDQAGS